MRMRHPWAGLLLAGMTALSSGTVLAAAPDKAAAEQAIAAGETARKEAAKVGGEWRDTKDLLKQANEALKAGDFATAVDLAEQARKQGEAGKAQLLAQQEPRMPSYLQPKGGKAVAAADAPAKPVDHVMIAADLERVEVTHQGERVTIQRSGDKSAHIPEAYSEVSRVCPPFCIQPAQVAAGVDTVGELEVLGYLAKIAQGAKDVLVVDSRGPEWIARGTIPGSVNVPWSRISVEAKSGFEPNRDADALSAALVNQFGAKRLKKGWDFSKAKTLVLFCNGAWCAQSATNIRTLLKLGYPAKKLKWYRGGMQDWVSLGLTVVKH